MQFRGVEVATHSAADLLRTHALRAHLDSAVGGVIGGPAQARSGILGLVGNLVGKHVPKLA